MARDLFIKLNQCRYCDRTGVVVWDVDLITCEHEVCKELAFAEVRRRHRDGVYDLPEKRLGRALLAGYDTFNYALHLDEHASLFRETEATKIRERERRETARLLSEIHALERRYPAPPVRSVEPPDRGLPSPRYRRFVRRGLTVPLRRDRRPARAAA